MDFVIPSEILGANFSLIVKEDGTFEKYNPKEKPVNKIINVKSRDFWERMKLYGISIPSFPPNNFKKPYEQLLGKLVQVPWVNCIPKSLYKKLLQEYINEIKLALEHNFSYYETYFSDTESIFTDVVPAVIDVEKFNKHLNSDIINVAQKAILKTFTPIHYDDQKNLHYTDRVNYSRTNSKTGRLVVTRGPNILHLKTSYREIIKSRYNNGEIYYLDYKSLEPRVLLSIKKPNISLPKDIYTHTLKELNLENVVDRAHVKTALISTINGAGEKEVARQLDGKVDYPEDFIKAIKNHFGLEELREKLAEEYYKSHGRLIYNYYNRPILCPQTPPYVLLNYYIQSTAVDVALLGFTKIWNKIIEAGATEYCQPIFILHDALILDVHPDLVFLLKKIAKAGSRIKKFDKTFFWIEVEKL